MRLFLLFAASAIFLSGCEMLNPNSEGGSPEGAVDLGLSVKWATCNLGASSPEDYGDFYAWGETKPKDKYLASNYKFNLGDGEVGPYSKYVTSSSYHPNDETYGKLDNKSVLELEDDAAHVKLGKKWRIPTEEEWTELWFSCKWEWTTINGQKGVKVTGDTGEWIFLPAAGYFKTSRTSTGAGWYWSSSVITYAPCEAHSFNFNSAGPGPDDENRYLGLTIRPVYD